MLESSTPAADSVLTAAPASVALVFDEGISLLPDSVRVFGPDGTEVDDGHVTHPGGVTASAGVGLHAHLTQGTYLVSWPGRLRGLPPDLRCLHVLRRAPLDAARCRRHVRPGLVERSTASWDCRGG